ncbi:MAG: type VI secretion system tube protein TssD [Bryobacteraceae bacterium]
MKLGSKIVTPGNLGRECHAFDYGVVAPRDTSTGQATGKRHHSAITIIKEVDAASPLFSAALTHLKVLPALNLKFVKANPQGTTRPYFTITLTDAALASYIRKPLPRSPSPRKGSSAHELEEIELAFQQIEVTYGSGGVSASDDWSA